MGQLSYNILSYLQHIIIPNKLVVDFLNFYTDLNMMLRELHEVTAEWNFLALALKIPGHEIEVIKKDHPGDSRACLHKMVERWFQLSTSPVSWSSLCTALREPLVSRPDIATRIEQKYDVAKHMV